MGHLDEKAFEQTIANCKNCEHTTAFEVFSYIDRHQSLMLADANGTGRWAHDGEKFIDGIYKIVCMGCRTAVYETKDCPRCHRPGGLADVLNTESRLTVPQRCPSCRGTETSIVGFAPATVKTGEGQRAAPTPTALYGDPGFHIVAIACDACDWARVAEGCPLCGNQASPLRARP